MQVTWIRATAHVLVPTIRRLGAINFGCLHRRYRLAGHSLIFLSSLLFFIPVLWQAFLLKSLSLVLLYPILEHNMLAIAPALTVLFLLASQGLDLLCYTCANISLTCCLVLAFDFNVTFGTQNLTATQVLPTLPLAPPLDTVCFDLSILLLRLTVLLTV